MAREKSTRFWGCLICKNGKNVLSESRCSICNTPRQKSRFVVEYGGILFLCRADTANLHRPTLYILDTTTNEHHIIPLGIFSDNLDDCILPSLEAYFEDDAEEDEPFKLHVPIISSDPDSQESEVQLVGGGSESLFDQLIAKGSSQAYDTNIGRYIPIETIKGERRTNYVDPTGDRFVENPSYVSRMRTAKTNLNDIVTELQERRRFEQLNGLTHFKPPKSDDPRKPCGICEHCFPVEALIGVIPFKAVVDWRGEHEAPIPVDIRFDPKRVYDSVRICLFCLQFFNKDFAEHTDEARVELKTETENKGGVLTMSTDSRGRIRPASHPAEPRPMSRMQLSLAMAALRTKKDTGERMGRYQMTKTKKATKIIDNNSVGTALRDKFKTLAEVEHVRRQREIQNKLEARKKEKAIKMQLVIEAGSKGVAPSSSPEKKKGTKNAAGGVSSSFLTGVPEEGSTGDAGVKKSTSASGPRRGTEVGHAQDTLPPRRPRRRRAKQQQNKLRDSQSSVGSSSLSRPKAAGKGGASGQGQQRNLASLVAMEPARKHLVSTKNVLPMLLVVRDTPAVPPSSSATREGETKAIGAKGTQETQRAAAASVRVIEAQPKIVDTQEARRRLDAMRRSKSLPAASEGKRGRPERPGDPTFETATMSTGLRRGVQRPKESDHLAVEMKRNSSPLHTRRPRGTSPIRSPMRGSPGMGSQSMANIDENEHFAERPSGRSLQNRRRESNESANITKNTEDNNINSSNSGSGSGHRSGPSPTSGKREEAGLVLHTDWEVPKKSTSVSKDEDLLAKIARLEAENKALKEAAGSPLMPLRDETSPSWHVSKRHSPSNMSPGVTGTQPRSPQQMHLSSPTQVPLSPSWVHAGARLGSAGGLVSSYESQALPTTANASRNSSRLSRQGSFMSDEFMGGASPLHSAQQSRGQSRGIGSAKLRKSAGAVSTTHFFDVPFGGDGDFVAIETQHQETVELDGEKGTKMGGPRASGRKSEGRRTKPRRMRSFGT